MEAIKTDIDAVNFLTTLKEATAKAHDDLESLPISSGMMRSDITLTQYQEYLQVMHQVMHEVEFKFFPLVSSVFPDISSRLKTGWITQDLAAMGISPMQNDELIFNVADETLPFYIGILYVIEGSTLGGRYILQNITAQLDFGEASATSFLNGYGNKTGSMWKEFTKQINAAATDPASSNDIIRGAQFAFSEIYHHFSSPLL